MKDALTSKSWCCLQLTNLIVSSARLFKTFLSEFNSQHFDGRCQTLSAGVLSNICWKEVFADKISNGSLPIKGLVVKPYFSFSIFLSLQELTFMHGLYTPYHHTGYWDLQCITFIKEKLHFLLRDDKIYKTASAHTTMSCSLFDLGDLGYIMLVYFWLLNTLLNKNVQLMFDYLLNVSSE